MCVPAARSSATTVSRPRFSMVRRPRVERRSETHRPSLSSQNRWVCRFGRKRRRFLMFEWETLLPVRGRFPVTWQTRDMVRTPKEPRIRPAALRAVKSACWASNEAFFGEGRALAVADDQVVQKADFDQG